MADMKITDVDLIAPEETEAMMDASLVEFYRHLRERFPDVYVNARRGQRVNKYAGHRPQDCKIGAKNSAHKLGKALDLHMLTQAGLKDLRLYIETEGYSWGIRRLEAASATPTWVHMDTVEKIVLGKPLTAIYTFNP